MKTFKAVLFDFDGVIGKTMEDNYQAWKYAFSKYNIDIDKNEYFLLEGFNTKKVAWHFLAGGIKNANAVAEIIEAKEKYYFENNSFSLYEGVEFLIDRLKNKGYLLGLVSGANYIRLSKSLEQKFLSKFDVVITGDKVDNCKPHPEPYLKAARNLSVNASDCAVIENAPVGIESAKEAGMFCIAICSTLDKSYLKEADMVVDNIAQLNEFL